MAAFLGGSYAAGTATEGSDIDLYVVTGQIDYPGFFAGRRDFVLSWAEGASLEDMPNFEGLGFDMLLVDKRGLLTDVTFPLL